MTGRLMDTVALVTGASSGIGAATARTLAVQGAAVAVVARRGDRLAVLADDLRANGGNALVLEADITDPGQVLAAVERTVAELGRLDTVVNNAGVMLTGPVTDAPDGEWQRMLAVNAMDCSMSRGPRCRIWFAPHRTHRAGSQTSSTLARQPDGSRVREQRSIA